MIYRKRQKLSLNNVELKKSLLLYAVTDRHWLKNQTLEQQVEEAIKGGATFVQLREKNADEKEFLELAYKVQAVCRKYNVPFIINDNVELAKKVNADGVHVGQSDMNANDVRSIIGNDKILGVSAQTVEQALLAQKQGADYLGVGAVFATNSKDDADYVPYETLKEICSAVKIPVVAIGGISLNNMSELKGSGIAGISVISAIFGADDIEDASKKLHAKAEELF
ncbi:MAG: thiamine phosphate synthase [Treponema sp.]|nr:thiamine phosphate synthase [Treponema sp.]